MGALNAMSELSRLDKRLTELEQLLSGYQLQLLNEAPTNAEAAAVGAAGEAVGEYEERQTLSESMQLLAEQSRAATVRAEEVSGYLQEVELRLLPVAEGLAAKACHTDPVTGQRRYGDAAQAKIHSCVATAAGLCAQLQAVQQQLMSRVQGLESELALLLREQQERLAVASTLSEKEAQKENRSAVEAQLQLEERRRKEQELAEKARAVRAKRQKEQEELNELHQQVGFSWWLS